MTISATPKDCLSAINVVIGKVQDVKDTAASYHAAFLAKVPPSTAEAALMEPFMAPLEAPLAALNEASALLTQADAQDPV